MLAAHIANIWNYRLFFENDTFKLRDVSTSGWNDKPYFDIRRTSRDLFLNVPWIDILIICLPILWLILASAQFYNTWLQFKIGFFELSKSREILVDGHAVKSNESTAAVPAQLIQENADASIRNPLAPTAKVKEVTVMALKDLGDDDDTSDAEKVSTNVHSCIDGSDTSQEV